MKTLQGTLTVLKDKEGNIKIPRTTASAVQFISGKTLETAIEDMYSKSEIDTMFANLTLNGEVTLGSYASKEYVSEAIQNHTHSYNDLKDKPDILSIDVAVSKEYLKRQLDDLPFLESSEILRNLNMKVDVIEGKGLSTYDFDDEYKDMIDKLKENLKDVALTGSYNDLKDTPLVDVTKSYVDAMLSMRAPLNHEHEQYLTYLPTHAHSDLYYTKSEVDKKVSFYSFKVEDMYEELLTEDKTIIGAINEIYTGRLTTDNVAELSNLTFEDTTAPVISAVNEKMDYMQNKIDALEARIRELESLLK